MIFVDGFVIRRIGFYAGTVSKQEILQKLPNALKSVQI